MCICVGNARAGRAKFSGRSAVVVVRGNSSGSSRGCDVVRAESANGCGEAGVDQVSVTVVGLLMIILELTPFTDSRGTYAVGVGPGVRQPHNGSQEDKTLHVD